MKLKYITRVDHGRVHCWWVRVTTAKSGYMQKSFTDHKHGGADQALEAAIRHLFSVSDEHPDIIINKQEYTVNGRLIEAAAQ